MRSGSGSRGFNVSKKQPGLSYKFQRLRERLRQTIESGELKGKLPGERELARRFHVNAKTLSKALTDLAAEGVLDRSIGRGTFTKGAAPEPSALGGRWLVLGQDSDEAYPILPLLRRSCPELQTIPSLQQARPSFLNQFAAVLDLSSSTSDTAIRNLVVRNMPIVVVGREPKGYSVNSVLIDAALAVTRLTRDLLIAGHRRIAAVEPRGSDLVATTLRGAVKRYGSDAIIETTEASGVVTLVRNGVTAIVCPTLAEAQRTLSYLEAGGIAVPAEVSITAIGCDRHDVPCSGYFVEPKKIAESVVAFLKEPPIRPTTLWMNGDWVDRGTLAPIAANLPLNPTSPFRVAGVTV